MKGGDLIMKSGIEKVNTKSKRERKNGNVTKLTMPVLGAKLQLTDKPTGKDRQEMGSHRYTKKLFNAEVNLIFDWVLEHRSESLNHNRYIHLCHHRIMFLYHEDSKFDLAENVVQVRDVISPKNDVHIESLDGARFISLSDYSVVDMMNPT
jgi:hypothetical protein